jgi:Amt family ammonium transporter
VAVTAPCAFVTMGGAFWIGLVAGTIVVLSVVMFDKLRLDDPVGALSVHLVNGVWGTLSLGLFASPAAPSMAGESKVSLGSHPGAGLFYGGGVDQLLAQLTGIGATAAYVFLGSLLVWFVLKATLGIRVSPEEELEGLDIGEHGMEAYPGFGKEEGREAHSSGNLAPEAIKAWTKAPAAR